MNQLEKPHGIPGLKRAVVIAVLTYAIFFMVPIILGVSAVIALDLLGIYNLKQPLDEQVILLGGLVFLFAGSATLWKRLVLSRKRLARLLEAEGFGLVEINGKHLIAEREGVRVSFVFDRPFMDYNPVPRSRLVHDNGRQVLTRKVSYDPRYMYRLSTLRICMARSDEMNLPALKHRLKSSLPDGVLESIEVDCGAITVVLRWGSWLGDSVMDLVREVAPVRNGEVPVR